ncbi:MAG: exodeoxyribonuclease VII large subunit [Chloroflexi bacterium]|nr:exodeoxyribonuclease VII large subunit [Chloroflexota bacterium]
MSEREPPSWALPAWDAVEPDLDRSPSPGSPAPSQPGLPADLVAGPPGAHRSAPAGTFGLRILGVSEVTAAVRDRLRADGRLADLWVEGEVGRVTVSAAGHAYFTLKDERSQLACVFFRDDRLACPFEPRTGLRVVAHGRLDVFEPQGVYQLYVGSVQPAGLGDLGLRFEATKARLAAEGLFERARKRPLPARPATIGLVTSASGAAIHDVRRVLARRWPLATLVVATSLVQGEGAAATIVAALDRLARFGTAARASGADQEAPAVVIVARGGGSLEDLWPFNEEAVVRAIAAHPVPVVTGIGHETDVTLADFAADLRAPTPSAAAELVVPDRAELGVGLAARRRRLDEVTSGILAASGARVLAERRLLARLEPAVRLADARERAGRLLDRGNRAVTDRLRAAGGAVGQAGLRLGPALAAQIETRRGALRVASAGLAALGPGATLGRGYAIVRRADDGRVVREPGDAPVGAPLSLRLAKGTIAARSEGAGPPGDRA